jgi:hypothetical protein
LAFFASVGSAMAPWACSKPHLLRHDLHSRSLWTISRRKHSQVRFAATRLGNERGRVV